MDPVQLNGLFTRVGVLLFGVTIYLALLVLGLLQWRGRPLRTPGFRHGWWGIGIAVAFGTLCILVAVLPGWERPTPYEAGKERAAPIVLVFMDLAFLFYVGWAAVEIVKTIRWLVAGRPPVNPYAPRSRPGQAARRRRRMRHRRRNSSNWHERRSGVDH